MLAVMRVYPSVGGKKCSKPSQVACIKTAAQKKLVLITMKNLITSGLCILLAGTTCGALAAENPTQPVLPDAVSKDLAKEVGSIRVKEANQGPTPAGIDHLNSPGTVNQIPTVPEVAQTPEMMEKVHKLEAEGEKLFGGNLVDKALIKWQEAYGLCLEMKYQEGQGRALINMARVYLANAHYVKAKYLADNAVEVLFETQNKGDLGKARVALAQAYFGLDNPILAGQQLELALKNYQEVGTTNARDSAQLTSICAGVLLKVGKFKEALMFNQASATYLEQCGELHASLAKRIASANIMLSLGLYTAALEEAGRALATAKSSKHPVSMPIALACLANCQYALGDYSKSLKTFEETIRVAAQLPSTAQMPDLSRANLELGYAHALIACGYLDQAKTHVEVSIPLFKKSSGVAGQAQATNALGIIEESQGQHEKAVSSFRQAMDLQGVMNPRNERLQLTITQNLAAALSRAGKNSEAKLLLAQCMGLFTRSKKPFEDAVLECRTMFSLGEVMLRLADTQVAQARLKDAVTLSTRIQDDATLWRAYTLLAKIAQDEPQPEVPVTELLKSALSHFRSPQAGVFPSPERLNYPTTRQDLGEQLVALLAKNKMSQEALVAAEQLKDELFIVEWNRRGGRVKPEDADLYDDLMTTRAHLHACEDSSPPTSLTKEWQKWIERFRKLVEDNRSLARLIAPLPNSAEQILVSMRNNKATMIDYLVGATSSVVFTMDGTGRFSASVIPVGQARLKEQVNALVNGMTRTDVPQGGDPQAHERMLLATLYRELIPPAVSACLPANPEQIVVIVPDGVLYNLPFAALIDEKGKYMIERHTLTMAPSLGVFMDSPPRYTDDQSLVVASGAQTSDDMFVQLFQPELVTRLVGKETPIASIQDSVRGKSVVHFSSKLPLHEKNPMDSVLPLAPSKDDGGKKVTADKLFGLSLPSDLMVWSGSSIYGKDIQGNAVKVFSCGLNYAGVRNVLMTLWSEPSGDRQAELVEFYKSKQAGLNQAQSLRRAQMLALSKDPSAKSWAAFQLLGPGF
jgi:CHAT domain-containing protein